MKNIIEIKNLTKEYKKGHKVLKNISLEIKEGKLFGLLGINGAGKSTLINILTGIIKKTSGTVVINGLDIDKNAHKIKSFVNYSPQETSIDLDLTVLENLKFFASIYGIKNFKDVEPKIASFKLKKIYKWKTKYLSGGWQRKLSIAIALITNAKILFLDEPTLCLDVFSRQELWNIIKQLKKEMTIVLTSHYLNEIEELCDEVAVLNKGKICAVGTPEQFKHKHKVDTFEQAFVKIIQEGSHSNEKNP